MKNKNITFKNHFSNKSRILVFFLQSDVRPNAVFHTRVVLKYCLDF